MDQPCREKVRCESVKIERTWILENENRNQCIMQTKAGNENALMKYFTYALGAIGA